MVNKKTFLIFVILIFFSIFANAIVVTEYNDTANASAIQNNAIIESGVTEIKQQLTDLTAQINIMQENNLTKDDVGIIRYNIDVAMAIWQQQILVMFLVLIFFTFALGIYGRSKRWF